MMYRFTKFKAVAFILPLLLCALAAHAQLAFTYTTTESTCQANGTIVVSASGGTGPYQYEILAGPASLTLPPAQNSNTYNALPSGTYSLKVVDLGTNGGPSITQSDILVTGNYMVPTMNPVPSPPLCYNTTDGKIVANASGGSLPYTFELVSPSVSIAGPQASDIFENLAPGDYSLRLTDGCGNVQTRVVTVLPGGGNIGMGSYFQGLSKVGCDMFKASVFLAGAAANDFKPPYTINYTTSNGIGDTVAVITMTGGQALVTPELFRISGYNTTASYTVTNGCNVTVASYTFTTETGINVTGITNDCKAAYLVYMPAFQNNQFGINMFYKSPVTYVLTNIATDAVVATQIDNPLFTDFPTGDYKVVLTDACGVTEQTTFKWEVIGPVVAYFGKRTDACLDGTAVITVGLANSKLTGVSIISGPATATNTKPGYEYTKSYNYPINLTPNSGDGNGPVVISANYIPGDYVVEVSGTCGPPITQTVTVLPSEVTDFSHTFSYVQGCTDANKLRFMANQNNGSSNVGHTYSITNSANVVVVNGSSYTVDNTFNNLPSDTYTVTFHTDEVWPSVLSCDVVHQETLVIPPYSQPDIKLISQALCGATSYAVAQPDLLKGAGPYTFAIRQQGAVSYGAFQSNPEFPIAASGTYDIQMIDGCGNSVSRSVFMGTVSLPTPTKTGDGCIGSTNTQISMPSNSYYTYSWKRPNGDLFAGDVLPINPVTSADIGTYEVTITSTLTGCSSSSATTITLNSNCQPLPVKLISFSVQESEKNVTLKWRTAMEEAMKGYTIERSVNARVFNVVGDVASNNVLQQKDWSFIDKTVVSPQTYYYRLKMVNSDESFSYSTIKAITLGEPDETLQLFANPVGSAVTNLKLPRSMENEILQINIFGADGRTIRNETIKSTGPVLKLDKLASLNSGIYLIQVRNPSGVSNTVRFVVP